MIFFGERCYSNQYDEIFDDEFSDDEISYDEISDDEIFNDETSASPDYHLQFTFGYQIHFRAVSSGDKNVQKHRVVFRIFETGSGRASGRKS